MGKQINTTRVSLHATDSTMAALETLTEESTKTDAINRAVQAYAYIQGVLRDGGALWVQGAPDGPLERLRFL